MNMLYICIVESAISGYNPEKVSPITYVSGKPAINGIAILESNVMKPRYRRDWQAAVQELQQRYGTNLERTCVCVPNVFLDGLILSQCCGITPASIIDVRWLGRAAFGNRPYESLSELHTRCGGFPLLPAEVIGHEAFGKQTVPAMHHIIEYLSPRVPLVEQHVIQQTAAMALSSCLTVDVKVLEHLLLQLSFKEQHPHLAGFAERVLAATTAQGTLPVLLDYSKAVTGRFAATKGCPIHGIPRLPPSSAIAYQEVYTVLAAISAPLGHTLVAADAKAIEPRLFAFMAGETQLTADLNNGIDVYTRLAQAVISNTNMTPDALRQIGKRTFLGFCYGIGADKLYKGLAEEPDLEQAVVAGIITPQTCAELLQHLKTTYPNLVEFGRRLETAVTQAKSQGTATIDQFILKYANDTLSITLPSGRSLHYYGVMMDDDAGNITYMAPDDETRSLYGAKLGQNIIQAIARDVLVNAINAVHTAYRIVYHVHDEIVCCVPDNKVNDCAEVLRNAWRTPPTWLPGIQLDAAVETSRNQVDMTPLTIPQVNGSNSKALDLGF